MTEAETLCERLLAWKPRYRGDGDERTIPLAAEAAAFITRQAEEIARLRDASGKVWEALVYIAIVSECEQSREAAKEAMTAFEQALKETAIAEGLSEALAGDIRALSIRQPWCHNILHDGKDVENRDWPTKRRGWFLIHAGKAWDGQIPSALKDVPRGGIVGAARIVDCVTEMDSRWFFGKFGFVLRDATPLPFVACKGALGFFRPDDAALEAVRAHLEKEYD